MDKFYLTAKSHVVHFKLDYCCWIAPVRIGLMITGYFNIIADFICLIGIANEGFSPTITRVQEILIEDFVNKPIPVLAYGTELGFSVLLLCAIYRRDLILMRVFMYYTMSAVVMSFLIYSIVIAAVPLEIQLAIIFSTMFQIYVIILVRSVIVEIRLEDKTYELPRLIMSSLVQDKVSKGSADFKNGQTQEVIITEMPKKQDVTVTIVPKPSETVVDVTQEKNEDVPKENKKEDVTKGNVGDAVKNKVLKQDADVKIEVETKKIDEKKNKDDKKNKEETTAKVKNSKDSKKDVKNAWLKTVNENPKE